MKLRFTKMHGAGNDFVVLDATAGPLSLSEAQYRHLADRRFGVGADQILIVEPGSAEIGTDFTYRIVNADGSEVEQCGNGARCFARFVHDTGLTDKDTIRVQTMGGIIEPRLQADGRVTVDMGAPVLEPERVPFNAAGLTPRLVNGTELWPLALANFPVEVAVVSMGNPHIVFFVDDLGTIDTAHWGPLIETHPMFPERVNVEFAQILNPHTIKVIVWERGTGFTQACGSGACAVGVAAIRRGLAKSPLVTYFPGGELGIEWKDGSGVIMTGPVTYVFEGSL